MIFTAKPYRILAVLLLVISIAAHAQIVGGTISGTVKDSTGAALAGATVTVRQIETGATRTLDDEATAGSTRHRFRWATTRFLLRWRFRDRASQRHLSGNGAEPAIGIRARRGKGATGSRGTSRPKAA